MGNKKKKKALASKSSQGPLAKPDPPSSSAKRETENLPIYKKVLFSGIITLLLLLMIEALLLLFGVQPVIKREDPYVGFQSQIRLFQERGDHFETAANKLALFNSQAFPKKKDRDSFRIFTLGGSTTYGRPYEDPTSFSGWLRTYLQEAAPDRKWELLNCGGISYASYRVAVLMEELVKYKPDLFIIYTGNNEFLEKRTYKDIIEEPEVLTSFKIGLSKSRLYTLMSQILVPKKGTTQAKYELESEVVELLDSSVGLNYYYRDNDFRDKVLAHYRFNLGRMIEMARGLGIRVILVTVPVNEKDFSPFKSQPKDHISSEERDSYTGLLARATKALADGDLKVARENVDRAVALDAFNASGHYLNGKIHFAAREYPGAAASFARAIREDVCQLRALPEINAAIREVAGRADLPLVDFEQILREEMKSHHGHEILGDELFMDHVHPSVEANGILAAALLERMAEMGILSLAGDWRQGAGAAVEGQVLGRVDKKARAGAYKNLSKVLLWAGKKEDAEKYALLAQTDLGADWEVHHNLGVVQLERGDTVAARASFLEAVELNPAAAHSYDRLGAVYAEEDKLDLAIEMGLRATQLDDRLAGPFNNLATYYFFKGNYPEAETAVSRALQLNREFAEAHNNLGNILFSTDRLEKAQASYARAISHRANFPAALLNRGLVLGELGRMDKAVSSFREALRLDTRLAKAHLGLGKALAGREEYRNAMRGFETALSIDASLVEAYEWLARSQASSGDHDAAKSSLTRGLAANPGAAPLHHLLGRFFAEEGRFTKALTHFEKATQLAPELEAAWQDLGQVYLAQNQPGKAIEVWQRALVLHPEGEDLHHGMAMALINANRVDEGIVHLEHTINLNPRNARAQMELAVVMEHTGNKERALTLYQKAYDLDPSLPGIAAKIQKQ